MVFMVFMVFIGRTESRSLSDLKFTIAAIVRRDDGRNREEPVWT
jgi:hypothetical protein